jgi:hypothetical protein
VILLICILSTWALLGGGLSSGFWLSAASTFQAIVIFILSFRWDYGGWERLDIICLVIALVGLLLWQTSGSALVALYAAILADIVGIIPTFVKTYKLPHTENWQFFAIDTLAGSLSLLAVTSLTLYAISYPVYIVLINGFTAILIIGRKRVLKGVQ